MDPQTKGIVLGALGTAGLAAILYLLKGNSTPQTSPRQKKQIGFSQNESFYALLGDIGGTNARFLLRKLDPQDRKANVTIKEKKY